MVDIVQAVLWNTNPHHFDAEPDPAFHYDADPDYIFHSDADPGDPTWYRTFQFDADPDLDPTTHFPTDLDPPMLQKHPLRLPPISLRCGSGSCFSF
jgi:hypothetical protein